MKKEYLKKITLKLWFACIGIVCLFVFSAVDAQVNVTDNQTATTLAQKLVGTGVTVLNPSITCPAHANGIFTVVSSNLGFDSGIIMSSGYAKTQPGNPPPIIGCNYIPDCLHNPNASWGFGAPGDAQLTALAGQTTHDACILQFDFKPQGDTINFQYIFGSEEYTAFTCSEFNDVFGFFISGPGITGSPNIAIVPGTANIPVCINSVNCGGTGGNPTSGCTSLFPAGSGVPFCTYYINNCASTTISYDGLTTILTAQAAVTPCDTYHLKLGVADASDDVYDSAVFLKAGSLSSPGVTASAYGSGQSNLLTQDAIRGCNPGDFVFTISPAPTDSLTLYYQISGTAVNGYDYAAIGDSIVIPPNATSDTLAIYPLGVPPTGPKSLTIKIFSPYTCGNGLPVVLDSVTLMIYDSLKATILIPDTTICNGASVTIPTIADSFLIHFQWSPGSTLNNDTLLSPTATPDSTTTYTLTATSDPLLGCVVQRDITITTYEINIDTLTNVAPGCYVCDGTITLHGLVPGESDTVSYTYDGVAQTPVVASAGSDSTITLINLCPGTYSNIQAKTNVCYSNIAGPDILQTPPQDVDSMSFSNPSYCGACNGTIYLHGLNPGQIDTVIIYSYYNPVTQAVDTITGGSYVIGADSSILLTNLCAGIYGDIVVQSGLCVSPGYGPITIQDPALYIANVQTTNPDGCNVCDGVIQLSSVPENQYDTVKYQYNGVWLNPPVVFPTNPNHTITLVNLCAGAYDSIIVSNKFGCVSNVLSDSLSGPVIQASFAYMVHPGCGGQDTVYFTNTSNPINDYTRWHFGDGTTDTVANPVHSYATGNTYNVTLYTSNLPCIDSITIPITLSHPLSAMFTSIPGDTLCQGQQITFTNTSAGGITSWLWNLGDGTIDSTDMNPPVHVYNNTGVYQVSLVVKDTIPCYDTAKATVYVDSNSAVSFKLSDSSICAGQQVIFTATYTRIGSEGINWNFGDGFTAGDINPVTHTYTSVMDSTVVTLNAGYRACPDTSAKKTVYIRPYPLLNLGGDTSLCPGSTPIALSDNINISTPGTKWVWNTGDTTAGIVVTVPGLYYVTVTEDGCSNRDSVWVKKDCYIDIPNVFTPNNDGVNDYFFPRNLLTSGVTEFKMEIYNRWGQQIFETGNTDGQGWDGKFNGTDQPEGVYVYIIDVSFKNGKKEHHQGNVTLLR